MDASAPCDRVNFQTQTAAQTHWASHIADPTGCHSARSTRASMRGANMIGAALFEADLREYDMPGAILRHMGVTAVRLMTNNPDKVKALEEYGLAVAERVPLEVPPRQANRNYLATKRRKFGHLLELADPKPD